MSAEGAAQDMRAGPLDLNPLSHSTPPSRAGLFSAVALRLAAVGFARSYETVILEEEEAFRKAGGHHAGGGLVGKSARLAAETILELPRR